MQDGVRLSFSVKEVEYPLEIRQPGCEHPGIRPPSAREEFPIAGSGFAHLSGSGRARFPASLRSR